jgi:EpsI family protein
MDRKILLCALAILAAVNSAVIAVHARGKLEVEGVPFEGYPRMMKDMKGTDVKMPASVYDALQADGNLLRVFEADGSSSGPRDIITLYVGYYGTEKGGRSTHVPMVCYPSSGWSILSVSTKKLWHATRSESVEINRYVVKKQDEYRLVYFWYQNFRGQVISNGVQQNLARIANRLRYQRDDGAFVRIEEPTTEVGLPEAERKMDSFAMDTINLLQSKWPKEIRKR